MQLTPGLAEELPTASQGGRMYSFRLRAGLRYSDGTPVRAGDFAHSVRRARLLSPPARRLFGDVAAIRSSDATRAISVRLWRPDPAFPYALASSFAGLVPGRTPLRAGRRPPPGVGPYELVASTPDGGFRLRRNRRFELPGIPAGNLDEITARPFADAGQAAREVIAGRIDYMQETPPVALLPDLRSKYSDRYAEHPALATRFLLLAPRPPLDRRRLRQAIAYAIDESKLVRLGHGLLEPTCNLLPQQLPGYRKLSACPWGNPGASPDLVRARALAERGPRPGPLTIAATPAQRAVAGYFARTLGTLGLRAHVRLAGVPRRARSAGEVVLSVLSPRVPDGAGAIGAVLAATSGSARSLGSLEPRLRKLGRQARGQSDQTRRAALAAELEQALVRGALAVPYGQELRTIFVSERLDLQNCARFQPLYGNDYSSFCLK